MRRPIALAVFVASLAAVGLGIAGLVRSDGAPPRAEVGSLPTERTTTTTTQPTPTSVIGVRSGRLEDLPAAAAAPVRVTIARPEISVPIVPIGVDDDAALAVPDDVDVAGWYRFGPSPGQPGSAVVTAHVDSATLGRGAFFELRSVEPGTTVEVEYDDGTTKRFTVTGRRSHAKATLPVEELFSRQGPAVLALVTCGGAFDETTRSYADNVVVYAVPESGS